MASNQRSCIWPATQSLQAWSRFACATPSLQLPACPGMVTLQISASGLTNIVGQVEVLSCQPAAEQKCEPEQYPWNHQQPPGVHQLPSSLQLHPHPQHGDGTLGALLSVQMYMQLCAAHAPGLSAVCSGALQQAEQMMVASALQHQPWQTGLPVPGSGRVRCGRRGMA